MNFKMEFEGVEDIKIDKIEILSSKNKKLKEKYQVEGTIKVEKIENQLDVDNDYKVIKNPLIPALILTLFILGIAFSLSLKSLFC